MGLIFFSPFHWMAMLAFVRGITDEDEVRGHRLMRDALYAEFGFVALRYVYAYATRNAAVAITAQ